MKSSWPRAVYRRVKRLLGREPDGFLRSVSGVIHDGQERDTYDKFGLRVLWVEPIPTVFEQLQSNLAPFPKQRAVQALVTDRDDRTYEFHISNNAGKSSSILDLKEHRDVWPGVEYTKTLSLQGVTLPSLLRRHAIDPAAYDALILDTQGSELLALQGAEALLPQFQFIKTEVADFEAYEGCCQLADLDAFMTRHGFKTYSKTPFARRAEGGEYYDVTYRRKA